jgi:Chromosome segregation ATPases
MDIQDYVGKRIIAWHYFNDNYSGLYGENKRCYVYPRYIQNLKGKWDKINPEDFPELGRIDVKIAGDTTADEIYNQKGEVVIIQMNTCPIENNSSKNWYSLRYNPGFTRGTSEIEIDKFFAKGLIQILDVNDSFKSILKNRGFKYLNINHIFTKEIILKVDNVYYGPFDFDYKEGCISLIGKASYQYRIGQYSIESFENKILQVLDNNLALAAIFIDSDSYDIFNKADTYVDWVSDDTLLDVLAKTLKEQTNFNYTKNQIKQIKEAVEEATKLSKEFELTEERRERIESLLNGIEQKDTFIQKIAYYILENGELSKKLVEIIESEHFEEIADKITELSSVKLLINQKKAELKNINSQLEIAQKDAEAITREAQHEMQEKNKEIIVDLENRTEQLKTQIQELNDEKNKLQEYVDCTKDYAELVANKAQILKDIEQARAEHDSLMKERTRLEDKFSETLQTFSDTAKTTAKALDSKLLDRVLKAASGEDIVEEEILEFDSNLLIEPLGSDEILEIVEYHIREEANRNISDNEIINYLICISQGFITTFAGEPGTGKTSICNILAKSLGLARKDKNSRFVEVSVERGWTSHKDFIGYFNPLTKTIEKSNSVVFDALRLLNNEVESKHIAPFFILLDEANLSPIEHYWASFLKICDFDSEKRSINLGGKYIWSIPNHLRFLATVNFDHTTEELSPRFLDRSWIITLEPDLLNEEIVANPEIINHDKVISYDSLNSTFLVRSDDTIDENILSKWTNIQKIFKNSGLPIMPRNLKMVQNYCKVACRLMDRQSAESRFAPLDFAVAQKILPIICGSGDQYKKLIEELEKECNSMPLCFKHIERIKKVSKETLGGYYQFFSK